MGNEQSDGNQFNQNTGYGNNKKQSHSNHYHGYQFNNNNNNNDYGHYQKESHQSDNYYGYEDYENEAEHPHIIEGNDDAEKILFAEDRRHQVVAYNDNRAIIKCIGYIDFTQFGGGEGTATVFKVTGGYAYAITAAQVVGNIKYGKFTRDTKQGKVPYQASRIKANTGFDIAVIKFQDQGGFYGKILAGRSVHLMDCDTIDYMKQLYYGLYGYPDPGNKSRAKRGELWGMEGLANGEAIKIKGHDKDLYIRKTKNNELVYNRFDTEAGQFGAAIYIELSEKEFGIIGIHTGESNKENSGVALTASIIKWINQ